MASPRASIGIISIGEMGLGIAQLLISQNYRVLTNITGRSASTSARAALAPSLILLPTDADLVSQSDYILSIVPPKDAVATARRVAVAAHPPRARPLVYLDLNAIAPSTARAVHAEFGDLKIGFVDGGIIGGPPRAPADDPRADPERWYRPSLVLSGPDVGGLVPEALRAVLRCRVVGADVGAASGLKCCFASLQKGYTALAIQSYTTAERLGVLGELRAHMGEFAPAMETRAARGLTSMPPKAGRWVREMQEIGRTFREDGGWEGGGVFDEIAEVYRYVTEETVLGEERTEARSRGKTVDDVVEAVAASRGKK